jgi:altronate hydrolase
MIKAIRIEEEDTVAVLLDSIRSGDLCQVSSSLQIPVREEIPFGHKIALFNIPEGDPVIKYGEVIGYATQFIPAGHWVHGHNLRSGRGRLDNGGER